MGQRPAHSAGTLNAHRIHAASDKKVFKPRCFSNHKRRVGGKAFRHNGQVANLGGFHGREPFQRTIHKCLKLIPVFLELVILDIFGYSLHPPGFRHHLKAAEKDAVGF